MDYQRPCSPIYSYGEPPTFPHSPVRSGAEPSQPCCDGAANDVISGTDQPLSNTFNPDNEEEAFNFLYYNMANLLNNLTAESHPILPSFGIDFKKTKNTKSMIRESADSIQVKTNAKLLVNLHFDAEIKDKVINNNINKVLFWTTFQSPTYKYPVECKDMDMRKDGTPAALSVFSLTSAKGQVNIEWRKCDKGVIFALMDPGMNFHEANICIMFKVFSSEVKEGDGWIFNCALVDNGGQLIAKGSTKVKALTIIRDSEGSLHQPKRKRNPSIDTMITPSPSTASESSENDEYVVNDLEVKTPEELRSIKIKIRQKRQKLLQMEEQVMDELDRRVALNYQVDTVVKAIYM